LTYSQVELYLEDVNRRIDDSIRERRAVGIGAHRLQPAVFAEVADIELERRADSVREKFRAIADERVDVIVRFVPDGSVRIEVGDLRGQFLDAVVSDGTLVFPAEGPAAVYVFQPAIFREASELVAGRKLEL